MSDQTNAPALADVPIVIEICPECLDTAVLMPGGLCRWCTALGDPEVVAALMRQAVEQSIARLAEPNITMMGGLA